MRSVHDKTEGRVTDGRDALWPGRPRARLVVVKLTPIVKRQLYVALSSTLQSLRPKILFLQKTTAGTETAPQIQNAV